MLLTIGLDNLVVDELQGIAVVEIIAAIVLDLSFHLTITEYKVIIGAADDDSFA